MKYQHYKDASVISYVM